MPRLRGRARRPDLGTWRREFGEDELDERRLSEEDIELKPRAPSVARSTRGRRPKLHLPPAVDPDGYEDALAEKRQAANPVGRSLLPTRVTRAKIWGVLEMASRVCTFLYFSTLVIYCVRHVHMNGQAGPPRSWSVNNQCLGIDRLVFWFNSKMPWIQQLGDTEEGVRTFNHAQGWGDSGPWQKNTDLVHPPCLPCPETALHDTAPGVSPQRIKPSVELPLPPWFSKYPAISNSTHQILDTLYEVTLYHPWGFLLLMVCAAWKATELLLRFFKAVRVYATELAGKIAWRMSQGDEQAVILDPANTSVTVIEEAEQDPSPEMSRVGREAELETSVENAVY